MVTSESPLTVVILSQADLARLEREAPRVALRLALAVADGLGREVARLSGDTGTLMRGRTLPRASTSRGTCARCRPARGCATSSPAR